MTSLIYKKGLDYPAEINTVDLESEDAVVQLTHSALNHRDIWIVKGMYANLTEGAIMGSDGVGSYNGKRVVLYPGVDWGENEVVFDRSFRVLGMPDHGTFTPSISIRPEYVFEAPNHLTDEEAAALPLAGLTAYRALFVRGQLKPGMDVLITGIGGGVALMGLQFALAIGCNVYVTSGNNNKILRAVDLGAKRGYNYKDEHWAKQMKSDGASFDVILDSAGGSNFNEYLKLANPGAKIVMYGGTAGKMQNISPQILFWKHLSILGSTMGSPVDFSNMISFVEKYEVKPIVDSVHNMSDYKDAFDRIKSGEQFGKVVLRNLL